MILSKVRKPFLIDLAWQPYKDWLWITKVSISDSYTAPTEYDTLGYTFDSYNTTATEISQVYVDNVAYDTTSSIESCIAIEGSFYFEAGTQLLYVHPTHTVRMDSSDFDSLATRGYCSGEGVFYDSTGFPYKPYLKTEITLEDEADRGVYEKISFVSNTLEFYNQENYNGVGEFDYAFSQKVPGADVNILYISQDDLDDGKNTLTPVYTGFVTNEIVTRDTYTLTISDKREQLSINIPNVYYDSDTYPNMDSAIGDLIPEGYGDLLGVPATCTNDTIETGDVTYKYATDGTSLDTVYVSIDDVWTEVTPTSYDATNCTFTLSDTDGRDDSDNPYSAKVDCTLRDYHTASTIIADMLNRYLDYPFNSDYFDFGSWTDEGALLTGDMGLLLDEREEFFEAIEDLQNGSNIPFIFRFDADGKFKIIVDDITRTVADEIPYILNFNDERTVSTDFTQYATSLDIKYNYDHTDESYTTETVDTYKEETLETYRLEQELEYTTLLTNQSDAQERGAAILKDYKDARGKHTIILREIRSDLHIFSVIEYDSNIYIDGVCVREYAGTVKIKVASWEYDFENDLTTLTGYDISDIVSKGTEVYSQGILNGVTMNGTTINGSTQTFQPEAG